ncbi:MAG: methyltransferase [Rhodospirillales bacterium]|nr:methyltransferase [Rhodospirillales bacterium]
MTLPLDPTDFVRRHTELASPPLCPGLKLHLATQVTPLWEATEASLAASGLAPPYWAFAWPGGQAIARYVLDHPDRVRGKTVLDFAAGSGLGAIAAAWAGAARVVAAEIDPFARAAIGLNALANGVVVETPLADALADARADWPVVLAGDVCYERPMAERVFAWLSGIAGRGGLVLMADPGRAYLPKAGLREVARYTVPTSRELEDRESRETVVYAVTACAVPT